MSPMPHIECPNCGSDWVTPIVYGLPGDELIDMAMQRYVTLGGCTVADPTETQPRFTEIRDVDGVFVVRFHDLNAVVLGMDNVDRIERVSKQLLSVADRNPLAVILDFEGTDFVPVASFENVLVQLHKKLDGKLSMCNLPATVAEQFRINQLATLFQIHAGLDDALGAVKVPHLELPKGQRIPLVADRLLVGRLSTTTSAR